MFVYQKLSNYPLSYISVWHIFSCIALGDYNTFIINFIILVFFTQCNNYSALVSMQVVAFRMLFRLCVVSGKQIEITAE